MKEKFKNYSFWVSLSGAVVVLFQTIGRAIGFIPDATLINDIIMSIAGLLVILGVVTRPDKSSNSNDSSDVEKDITSEQNEEDLLEQEEPEEKGKE